MDLFVYGTLQSRALMGAVAGGQVADAVTAALDGYRIYPKKNDVVPLIAEDRDQTARGVVYTNLDHAQMHRLNTYEGAFGYTLQKVCVDTNSGPMTVSCYLPPSSFQAEAGQWSYEDWQIHHEAPAIYAAEELFRHDPLPDLQALQQMWPMIEARAWAKHRSGSRPTTQSFAAQKADMEIHTMRPPQGAFFRLQSIDVSHKRFQGGQSDRLTREVFSGVDAVIVLPYDPVRDKVLFVEQFRTGPLLRDDPNPWMMEAVAGMIDARETPDAAALREVTEEAQLSITHLEPAGAHYPSPGSSTDYFYYYVGLCDLPMDTPYHGGLAEEGEDLRLHPMSFDDAMRLLNTGEIATGPVYFLLYWLAYHRDRLRQMA